MGSFKVKEILCYIYSAVLFISGIIIITLCAMLCYKLFYHFKFVPSGSVGPFITLFLLGFVHLFVTWLGFKGPQREHDFHIYLFMAILLILLCCEFAIGVWSMVIWGEVKAVSGELLAESFKEMIITDYNKKEWVKLQVDLKCCGLNGSHDYAVKDSYPKACSNLGISNGTWQILHEDGCQPKLIKYTKNVMIHGALMGFLSCLYQALGIFVFYTFLRELQEERKKRLARILERQRELQQEVNSQQQPVGLRTAPPTTSNS